MADNVEVIESLWEAFGRGDAERAASVFAPNAEIISPERLPWGGVYEGPEGFVAFLEALRRGIAGLKSKPLKILGADDNHVVVVAQSTGRGASGARLEVRVVWLYELRDGAVTRAEAFTDTAAIVEALG
jgi:ketosteroid isomerase-like protein